MTVERLIKELKKYNPKARVRLHGKEGEELLFVLALVKDEDNVWVEGESENDIEEEIRARFNAAVEEGIDETDIYADMLEIGIDVDMVRRNTDDETADHMEKYCKEHGLL